MGEHLHLKITTIAPCVGTNDDSNLVEVMAWHQNKRQSLVKQVFAQSTYILKSQVEARTKWSAFSKRHCVFSKQIFYILFQIDRFFYQMSNRQHVSISSDKGLRPSTEPNMNMLITLNVRGPSYLGLTRSISWLLMPWLLTSPGHQQPWYWLYRICRSLSYLRKDFKYLCHINVEEWHKM